MSNVLQTDLNIEDVRQRLIRKEITQEDFHTYFEANKHRPEFFCFKATDDNRNCKTLPYHPDHPKGFWYQAIIKKAILKAIDFAHNSFVQDYDKNGFVFEDVRLKRINAFTRNYLDTTFIHCGDYKRPFLHKIADIVFSLVKYDRQYAPLFFDFLNKFRKEFPEEFELLDYEKAVLERRPEGKPVWVALNPNEQPKGK